MTVRLEVLIETVDPMVFTLLGPILQVEGTMERESKPAADI